jgi:hypothetical protein
MATKIALGVNGKVVCPFCGYVSTFAIAEKDIGYVLWFDDVCKHLNDLDWELMPDTTVAFTAHSDDEDE